MRKKINIDEFGRYKGGLPQRKGQFRGKSLGKTGQMYRQGDLEDQLDRHSEFNVISKEKSESFKDFHQDEREARTMKWPWFTFQVDYDYFTLRTFRTKYWPRMQLFVILFYIIPSLYYIIDKFLKKEASKSNIFNYQDLKEKAAAKAQAKADTA